MGRSAIALLLALAACSEADADRSASPLLSSPEPAISPFAPSPANATEPSSTADELAMLATRVCVPQLEARKGAADQRLARDLDALGYRVQSAEISRQLLGRVEPTLVAARKKSASARFLIAFGGPLPGCVILLTDNSVRPSLPVLQAAFFRSGWSRSGLMAIAPDKPKDGFLRSTADGRKIFAVVNEEPTNDRSVRLAIEIELVSS